MIGLYFAIMSQKYTCHLGKGFGQGTTAIKVIQNARVCRQVVCHLRAARGDAFLCTMGKMRGLIPIVPVCLYQYSGKLIILVLDISKTFTCTNSQSGLLVPVFAREKSIPFRAETKTRLRTFILANIIFV